MRVQLVNPDGFISEDSYETDGEADRKNIVNVLDSSGKAQRVHKRRLVPASDTDRYAAVKAGNRLKAICPHCGRHLDIIDRKATCPIHGQKDVVSNEDLHNDTTKPMRENKEMEMSTKQQESIPVVDIALVATFGTELWTNNNLKFSDPKTDAKAHALLAENPLRKLCFNTYNGTLGKRHGDPIAILHLHEFLQGVELPKTIGIMVYHLKGTIEQARMKLKKSGYTQAALK